MNIKTLKIKLMQKFLLDILKEQKQSINQKKAIK